MRAALAALFLMTGTVLAAPAPDPSTPEPGHMVDPTKDAKGAVTRQEFESRFETSATEMLVKSPGVRADRFAAFDIAWPHDVEEWKRTGGNAVILLGALSQNQTELPLAGAYLERADGSRVELRRLGRISRTLAPSSQAAKVFGPHVTEEFYLVPADALGNGVMLKCDFAKNRLAFVLSNALPLPRQAPSAQSGPPLMGAVRALVAREYPRFGVTLTDATK
jgi:hypothetical protein